MFTNPAVADFKNYFVRDFPYGTDPNLTILDQDIANAYQMTNLDINPANWPDQSSYNIGYFLLSAHFLVLSIRRSSQGLNGQYNFLQQSKGVGQVNEAFSNPERVLGNPKWEMYYKTNYGAAYLELLLPQLIGQFFTVRGTTRP